MLGADHNSADWFLLEGSADERNVKACTMFSAVAVSRRVTLVTVTVVSC